ncbi:hypothetical protein CANCADRAFT_29424 [Tortispora caseinolytica NRRL Y-17796]|uniref:Diphthamide biosynthesis protein 3 n=1 Tax=Tortispora caseinolytica NRRL Y-17796 TaxID=767744 RepID=A0A1E4TA65_9ASCO|nr:hypothetical protein CANCADRAFT_29424 [Tortispora caseinolytica NRRL Y-17796]
MSFYDEIEIEDMTYDPDLQIFTYPCPCGDKFQITLWDLADGEDTAVCPSCSLMIQVIFEPEYIAEKTQAIAVAV